MWEELVDWEEMDRENKGWRGLNGKGDTLTNGSLTVRSALMLMKFSAFVAQF